MNIESLNFTFAYFPTTFGSLNFGFLFMMYDVGTRFLDAKSGLPFLIHDLRGINPPSFFRFGSSFYWSRNFPLTNVHLCIALWTITLSVHSTLKKKNFAGVVERTTIDYSLKYWFILWCTLFIIALLFIGVHGIAYVSWPRLVPLTDLINYSGPGYIGKRRGRGLGFGPGKVISDSLMGTKGGVAAAIRKRVLAPSQEIELGTLEKKRVDWKGWWSGKRTIIFFSPTFIYLIIFFFPFFCLWLFACIPNFFF